MHWFFITIKKPHFGPILGRLGPETPAPSLYKLDNTLTLCYKIRKVLQTILQQTDTRTERYLIGPSLCGLEAAIRRCS